MFKIFVLLGLLSGALCAPAPEAKPGVVVAAPAAYSSPVLSAPLAYTAGAYVAPVGYVGPSVFNAGYTAYSPYSGSLVVV